MAKLHAVIMAGGSGTRFWPASRQDRPKQLLPLAPGGKTLIEATVDRLRSLVDASSTWIVTNPNQVEQLKSTLTAFDERQIIVEPEPRDTAACIGLSVARLEAIDPGTVVAILPSDHVIEPTDRFVELLRRGAAIAADGKTIVTFGIKPTRPATGFGYIEPGRPLDGDTGAREIARFREKPNLDTAREFVSSGRFLWNSGIFLMTANALLDAMRVGSPALEQSTRQMIEAAARGDLDEVQAAFRAAPRMSVDYAVMEKAPHAAVLEADLRWSDLGSFLALGTISPPDENGNVRALMDGAESTLLDARDCVVYGEGKRTIAMLGTHDLVCVAVGDAVLVCPKHRVDDMKSLVQQLRDEQRTDLL